MRLTCSCRACQMSSASDQEASSDPSSRVAHGQAPRDAQALLPIVIARRTVRGSLASMSLLMASSLSPWRFRAELAHMQIATCEQGRHFAAGLPRLVSALQIALRRMTSSRFSAVTEGGTTAAPSANAAGPRSTCPHQSFSAGEHRQLAREFAAPTDPHRRPTPTVGSPTTGSHGPNRPMVDCSLGLPAALRR